MNQPPAGWYQDPEGPQGQTRWWDGEGWTDQRAAPVPQKPQWTTSAPKGNGPWRRFRAWPGWVQAAAWVTVGLLLVAAFAGEADDPGSTSGSGTSESTTSSKRPQRPTSDAVADAAVVCGVSSRRKFAANFRLKTMAPKALATRYARGYDASVRPKVYAACLKAIRARSGRVAAARRARARIRARQARTRRVQQKRVQAAQARKLKRAQAAEAERRRQQAAQANRQQQEEQQADCQPGYSPCLKPDAGDYDCDGGSGDGPNYTGSVSVTGDDVFDLDRDGDGSGCD